ncbi:ATP-binding protein [Niallia sp. 03190]|uniref:ATP-binding protein n=1 Tax=Niallia sp. 03190 TaxID=3458061 RepID=UPI004044D463
MKVRLKIQLFSTLFLFIIILVVNMFIYFLFQKLILTDNVNKTTVQMEQIAKSLRSISDSNTESLLRAYIPTDGMIRLINSNDSVVFTSTTDKKYVDINAHFIGKQTEQIIEQDDRVFTVTTLPVIWHNGDVVTLELAENIQSSMTILHALRIILIISTLIVIIPTFLAGRILSNVILNPIQSMINTMEEIQIKGDLKEIDLPEKKKDELYQLGATFNKMITLLKRQFEQQQQFVSDASHELKTPLTVIESYANMLKRWGMKREEVLIEAIEAIHSESIRMKEMTNQMLELANADGHWKLEMNHLNLLAICQDTARNMETVHHRKISVYSEKNKVSLYGDQQKIKQLLFILLENAIKFSSDSIHIRIDTTTTCLMIEISDKGPGIPKEEQALIFERFYRVDKARTRESEGTGLGLSIAKKIVEAHKGIIFVKSAVRAGTTFICQFPLIEDYKEKSKGDGA